MICKVCPVHGNFEVETGFSCPIAGCTRQLYSPSFVDSDAKGVWLRERMATGKRRSHYAKSLCSDRAGFVEGQNTLLPRLSRNAQSSVVKRNKIYAYNRRMQRQALLQEGFV